jgi:alpha-beta hydrolase superfamily lysophospholipase
MQTFQLFSNDNIAVQAYAWPTDGKPSAVIQIAHGMQEHAQRYAHFAKWLNAHGIAVYANDHIGHGSSIQSLDEISHFPGKEDWQRSVDILYKLSEKIRKDFPGVPLVVLGHSMGSVLVQSYMIRYGKEADAYILSGAIRQSMLMANIGSVMAKVLSSLYGIKDRSRLIIFFGYGQYNKHFKPNRTGCDWLTRDQQIVDEYIHSPLCGIPLTNGFYRNFFKGFRYIACRRNLMQIPSGKPVLIIAGKSDPAGFFGKAPLKISKLLSKFAKAKVEMKLYPECRHEILNETNREEVYRDLLDWMRNINYGLKSGKNLIIDYPNLKVGVKQNTE